MSDLIQLTILVENTAQGRDLLGEHGWSVHIRGSGGSFLFDTGQSRLLRHNADILGIDLASVQAVALSHGHFDHTGGLPALWEVAPRASLYLHPAAPKSHFARNPDGSTRTVGMAAPVLAALREQVALVNYAEGPVEFRPGFFLTGAIPRATDFEDVGGPFVLDEAGTQPDPITDDQALYFDTRDGVVVVLGCGHAGVINTLRHVRRLTHGRPLHAVLGGMHLLAASPERLARTFTVLRELGVTRLGPAHCTGIRPTAQLWTEFASQCFPCGVGTTLVFQR
jgi:7,8-dihydropterin-6-yl-methyl-4-(beta-D-ribofuranosyl)aminobenzene 5'-phosphate synthase